MAAPPTNSRTVPKANTAAVSCRTIDSDQAWDLLLTLTSRRRQGDLPLPGTGVALSADQLWVDTATDHPEHAVVYAQDHIWRTNPALSQPVRDLLELYLPILSAKAERPIVSGHLGQSVDAQIATRDGDAFFVTGEENIEHLHRMRALCDAIIVGANTVAADDPQLTTRKVPGEHPVRIVIDPQLRLARTHQVFADGMATTLLACNAQADQTDEDQSIIAVPADATGMSLSALLTRLCDRGLHAVFIEGGGVTLTRWMNAGLLDRLQIATAPLLVGAGRPALQLPGVARMANALRPDFRLYRMGSDVLWDFDLRSSGSTSHTQLSPDSSLERLL